jgi:hypothetical protein
MGVSDVKPGFLSVVAATVSSLCCLLPLMVIFPGLGSGAFMRAPFIPFRSRILASIPVILASTRLLMSPLLVWGLTRKERSSPISFRENPSSWARLMNWRRLIAS